MVEASVAHSLIQSLAASPETGPAFRRKAMEALSTLPEYQWSGVYRLEGDMLVLDEYVGDATDHTRIPVGRGVCGTAVAENRNQVIEDVRELQNYLSCSLKTRSEIVVLIRRGEEILGQIDIDGHTVSAFDSTDETLLEQMAVLMAERWERRCIG